MIDPKYPYEVEDDDWDDDSYDDWWERDFDDWTDGFDWDDDCY